MSIRGMMMDIALSSSITNYLARGHRDIDCAEDDIECLLEMKQNERDGGRTLIVR